jgi:Flp pilus assembly protein TadG
MRRGRAQSVVEFALVVPLFLLLLFGLIDFSRLLFTYASLTNGARELARSLSISSNQSTAVAGAFNNLTVFGGATSPATSITFRTPGGSTLTCSGSGDPICTVAVTSTSSAVTLSYGMSTISYATSSSAPFNYSFNPSGNGDFVALTFLAPDRVGLQQGYIQLCRLPFSSTCGFPSGVTRAATSASTNGSIQVDLRYTFQFNPLFQNRLGNVVDVSFMRAATQLSTSVRTYAE